MQYTSWALYVKVYFYTLKKSSNLVLRSIETVKYAIYTHKITSKYPYKRLVMTVMNVNRKRVTVYGVHAFTLKVTVA